MGTTAHVVVAGGDAGRLGYAKARIEDLERRWSRFDPDSEVSRLNASAGNPVVVSADTCSLVSKALCGWRTTHGRYDPTVLADVVRAGYDRPLDAVRADPRTSNDSHLAFRSVGASRVVVDSRTRMVWLPRGVGIDPGGIGKGLAADLVVGELLAKGARGACVNIGGDLRVDGAPPEGDGWRIDVCDPWTDEPTTVLHLTRGSVATSTRLRRTWLAGTDIRHHLIDPATGRPAECAIASTTVVASHGWRAEVLAKGAFLAGVADGLQLLDHHRTAGIVVTDGGFTHTSARWSDFTEGSVVFT